MKFLPILISMTIFLVGCSKDDDTCTQTFIGTYMGTCTSIHGTLPGTVIISGSGTEDTFIVVDNFPNSSGVTYTAVRSSECGQLIVASQDILLPIGLTGKYSGTLELDGTSLTGTMTVTLGTEATSCVYSLERQ